MNTWLAVAPGDQPLIVSIPHAGTHIPAEIEARLASPWLARKDTDWHIDRLYDFAASLGATVIGTAMSRTVIDVNRDPAGLSLYPGLSTTGLCPTETFDGEPLYRAGQEPQTAEIAQRRTNWLAPYHAAITREIDRLRAIHPRIVLYDAHSIRSRVPRLFEGTLPELNLGTNGGVSCAPALQAPISDICARSGRSWVVNQRFRGGYITRHFGQPASGVHAVQMELACRSYCIEPAMVDAGNWPPTYDRARAAPLMATLRGIFQTCLTFAKDGR